MDNIRAEDPVHLHGTLSQPHSEPSLYPRTVPGDVSNAGIDEDNEYFAINSERNITTDTPTNNIPDMPELEDSDSEELTMDDFRNRRRSDLENIGIDEVDDDADVTSSSKCSSEIDGGTSQQQQQQQQQQHQQTDSTEGVGQQPVEPCDSKEYKDYAIIDSANTTTMTTTSTDELNDKANDTVKTPSSKTLPGASEPETSKTPETSKNDLSGTTDTGMTKMENQGIPAAKDVKKDNEIDRPVPDASTVVGNSTGNVSTSAEGTTTVTPSWTESRSVVNITTTVAGTSGTTSVSENVSGSIPVSEASLNTNDTPTTVAQTISADNANTTSVASTTVSEASSSSIATASITNISGTPTFVTTEVVTGKNGTDSTSLSTTVASSSSTVASSSSTVASLSSTVANTSSTVASSSSTVASTSSTIASTSTTVASTSSTASVAEAINGVEVVTEESKNTDGNVVDGKTKDKNNDDEDDEKMLENSKAWMQEKLLGLIGAIIPSNERSVRDSCYICLSIIVCICCEVWFDTL